MKVILGLAGAYLLLLWTLLAAVFVMKAATVTYDWGRLGLVITFAALPTVAAVRSSDGLGFAKRALALPR